MKIYTKTGDFGQTTTVEGERIPKNHIRIELQGSIDEINANLGYLTALIQRDMIHQEKSNIEKEIREVQYCLFKIGSSISYDYKNTYITEQNIRALELAIDRMTEVTGILTHFIYYNGHVASTYTQVVRSVVRRAERVFVASLMECEVYPLEYKYINRLADYLFALGRYINRLELQDEIIMKM